MVLQHGSDFFRIGIKDGRNIKPAGSPPGVGHERATEVACSDQGRVPRSVGTEDLAEPRDEFGNVVTDPRMSELAEVGQILPHLCIGQAERRPELLGRNRSLLVPSAILQFPQIQTETFRRRTGDSLSLVHAAEGVLPAGEVEVVGGQGRPLTESSYDTEMHIQDVFQRDPTTFSFEFFPPKSDDGWENLFSSLNELAPLNPSFVSVTYGAGGGTRERTHNLVVRIKETTTLDPVPHLTCVCHTYAEIDAILSRYAEAGVSNILALKGDPPRHLADYRPEDDDFRYAADLVSRIRTFNEQRLHPDPRGFGIGIAGFPEGHPTTPNQLIHMDHLKAKVEAGADYVCTQMFFDNRSFYDWRDRCELAGIDIPLIAGIMPVTSMAGLRRMADLAAGTNFPAPLLRALARVEHDPDAVQRVGIHWATEQCLDLLDNGVRGIHFYTLNKSDATRQIYQTLGAKDSTTLMADRE